MDSMDLLNSIIVKIVSGRGFFLPLKRIEKNEHSFLDFMCGGRTTISQSLQFHDISFPVEILLKLYPFVRFPPN